MAEKLSTQPHFLHEKWGWVNPVIPLEMVKTCFVGKVR